MSDHKGVQIIPELNFKGKKRAFTSGHTIHNKNLVRIIFSSLKVRQNDVSY